MDDDTGRAPICRPVRPSGRLPTPRRASHHERFARLRAMSDLERAIAIATAAPSTRRGPVHPPSAAGDARAGHERSAHRRRAPRRRRRLGLDAREATLACVALSNGSRKLVERPPPSNEVDASKRACFALGSLAPSNHRLGLGRARADPWLCVLPRRHAGGILEDGSRSDESSLGSTWFDAAGKDPMAAADD